MTHPSDSKPTETEIAAVESAATDAEQRYQARERGLRAAAREVDAAEAHAEHERLNPPMLYRGGDGPQTDVRGLEGIPLTRQPGPIERYVRAQVAVPGTKGRIDGRIEIGIHYDADESPSTFRPFLLELGAASARCFGPLDEDEADRLTKHLDAKIVARWGDRPRFIEVWHGDDDSEPLTQVYAPHGMPRSR